MELAGSRVPPHVLGLLGRKIVAIGVIDVATEVVETPDDVRATIELARQYLPDERIVCSTNCGMARVARDVAYAKLRALGAGAVALALAARAIRSAGCCSVRGSATFPARRRTAADSASSNFAERATTAG